MQVKLLRALQEREIRRVGENRSRPFDVRILAATNRDLAQDVAAGAFRQDLYYRLKIVELHVPPLRDRRDDILPLARVLLGRCSRSNEAKGVRSFSARCRPALALRLARQRARAGKRNGTRSRSRTRTPHRVGGSARRGSAGCAQACRGGWASPSPRGSRTGLHTRQRWRSTAGNQRRTADQLRIGSATLYRKLKRYGRIPGKPRAAKPKAGSSS